MSEYKRFYIETSGLCVEINAKYPFVFNHCRKYMSESRNADISVSVTDEDIKNEMALYGVEHSESYCEDVCLYRAIAEKLPKLDRFVFHGAAVSIGDRGFIFTAPSGTGKTTHIRLLMDNYPDDVAIINGDKPIIHLSPDGALVCSTPWAGKEDWNANRIVPLHGICLVKRAEVNSIRKIEPKQYFSELFRQAYVPMDAEARLLTLDLLDRLAKSVQFYLLECNISPDAAKCSYEMLSK